MRILLREGCGRFNAREAAGREQKRFRKRPDYGLRLLMREGVPQLATGPSSGLRLDLTPAFSPGGKWRVGACSRLQRRDRARFSRASDNRCKVCQENSTAGATCQCRADMQAGPTHLIFDSYRQNCGCDMHPVSAMQSALRHGFCGPSSPYPFTYTYTMASSPSRDRVRSRDWPELVLIQIAIGIGIVHFKPSRAAPLAMGSQDVRSR